MPRAIHALICMFAMTMAPPVLADPFWDAVGADQRGDHAFSLPIYKQLATQGDVRAEYRLGQLYESGGGVPLDYVTAISWYKKAAEKGHQGAQYNLGFLYYQGKGTRLEYVQAAMWWRRAAEQGNPNAQSMLGMMCAEGKGVPQDFVQAHKWYNLAAAHSVSLAAFKRDEIAKSMTPAQIAEAQRLATEWKPSR